MEKFIRAKTSTGSRLMLSPALCQLLHPPPPLDSTRVGRETEGKPSRSSGKAPKLLLFCTSAFPLNDQCHGLERQLWDVPPLPRNARNSCLEVVQFQQLLPTRERGRAGCRTPTPVLFTRHPGPLQGCRHPKIQENLEAWQLLELLTPLFYSSEAREKNAMERT